MPAIKLGFGRRPPDASHRYGPARSQKADLYLPPGGGPHPVVVLVHGGFWTSVYDLSLMAPLAVDLATRGFAAWNIEFRRVGEQGGGWPGTFHDVAAAVDLLAELAPGSLDLSRVASCGHSSGGHLAMWLAGRRKLPPGSPGAGPAVSLAAAISQAGVVDLGSGARGGMGRPIVGLMGCLPDEDPERYRLASPMELLPVGVPQLLVHGRADRIVAVSQSERYAERAAALGEQVELYAPPRVGHFEPINPRHSSWKAVAERLPRLLGEVPGRFLVD
ncbi:MAG: alpha/beta hydrolase family protein [Actinomycetota bacterium]